MLILARSQDEQIIVGDDVVITIIGIREGKVRLGIEAPDDVRVDRMEVRERIEREKSARRVQDAKRKDQEQ